MCAPNLFHYYPLEEKKNIRNKDRKKLQAGLIAKLDYLFNDLRKEYNLSLHKRCRKHRLNAFYFYHTDCIF